MIFYTREMTGVLRREVSGRAAFCGLNYWLYCLNVTFYSTRVGGEGAGFVWTSRHG